MREIKFRAWDKKGGHMVEWHVITQTAFNDSKMIAKAGGGYGFMYEVFTGHNFDLELMQFTGLHDKNGREIYEGDVLEAPNQEDILYEDQGNYLVKWNDDEASMMCYRTISDGKILASFGLSRDEIESLKLEVIGNIHETPELLEGK